MEDEQAALAARVMELEIRSEERREEIRGLLAHIGAYEDRVAALEQRFAGLAERLRNPAEAMPTPEEDRPPHY